MMKVCPVCKSRCFDDMDKCYGCLHDFTQENLNNKQTEVTQKIPIIDSAFKYPVEDSFHIPEYFELDTFPCIEDDTLTNKVYDNQTITLSKNEDKLKIKIEIPSEILRNYW